MKQSSPLILVTLLVFMYTACDSAINASSRVREVLEMKGSEQRLAYSMLSPQERIEAWQVRLDMVKRVQSETLGKNSTAFQEISGLIDQMVAIVSDPRFNSEDRTLVQDSLIDAATIAWIDEAEEHLNPEEVYTLGYTLSMGGELTSVASGKAAAERVCSDDGCCCNKGSWFTCPRFGVSTDVVGVDFGACQNTQCSHTSSWGCGFGGLWSCNGGSCEF